ncbi:molybdopterin-dependent oxidoreductase [Hoeflea sp. CAU 1731]
MPQSGDPLVSTHWGTYRARNDATGAKSLAAFEDDPDPSPIGDSIIETLSDSCRIARPMIRKGYLERGDTAHRGQDSFVAVSWEEALDLAARELTRIRADYGNEAIYAGSYGWASAGRFHHAQSQLRRLLNLFGGYTASRNTYSYAAAEVVLPHVVAPLDQLFNDHTSWRAIGEARALVVAFGGVSLRNSQINPGGVARHTHKGDIADAVAAGAHIVSITPSRDEGYSNEWTPIRPNTDLALMLGLAHTLTSEGLHDKDFLTRYCTGFDKFESYICGETDGLARDADWAAVITGVDADTIRALARRMAKQPTVVNASWSLTRQHNGEMNYWMTVVLAAMLGGVGRKGEGFALGLGAVNSIGNTRRTVRLAALPTGRNPVSAFIPVARIADMLLHPGQQFRYNGQTLHYPDIRLVYWAGGNPFHHHQDLNRLRKAWRKPETVIVHEPHWTPLARHADIVFPATLPAERNDIAGSPRDTHLFATKAIAAPFAEARDDHDIFAGLAARLTSPDNRLNSLEAAFTGGKDKDEWLQSLYDHTRDGLAETGVHMPAFEAFREAGFFAFDAPEDPCILLKAFRDDPDAHPLPTPSGRIEIFSETIAGFGIRGNPGHPTWTPPVEWLGARLAERWPIHLVTHQPARRLHSQLDQARHSLDGKIGGREACVISKQDATRRGLRDGDVARIFNDRGSCLAGVRICEDVLPGVAMMPTGAWLDLDESLTPACCKHGNVNIVTADRATSELAQGPAALSCLVEIERHKAEPPPVTAHRPPKIETA